MALVFQPKEPPVNGVVGQFRIFIDEYLPIFYSIKEPLIIEVYGDTPQAWLCSKLAERDDLRFVLEDHYTALGIRVHCRYVEHFVPIIFSFSDALQYEITLSPL